MSLSLDVVVSDIDGPKVVRATFAPSDTPEQVLAAALCKADIVGFAGWQLENPAGDVITGCGYETLAGAPGVRDGGMLRLARRAAPVPNAAHVAATAAHAAAAAITDDNDDDDPSNAPYTVGVSNPMPGHGGSVSVQVRATDTVRTLRQRAVAAGLDIPPGWLITYARESYTTVDDESVTLEAVRIAPRDDVGFVENLHVQVLPPYRAPPAHAYPVLVKMITNKTITAHVNVTTLVLDLKRQVENAEGIPVDQQKLFYNNQQLDTTKCLGEYGVCPNGVIHLILRLRGD